MLVDTDNLSNLIINQWHTLLVPREFIRLSSRNSAIEKSCTIIQILSLLPDPYRAEEIYQLNNNNIKIIATNISWIQMFWNSNFACFVSIRICLVIYWFVYILARRVASAQRTECQCVPIIMKRSKRQKKKIQKSSNSRKS